MYINVPVYGVDYMCFTKAAILVFKMAVIKRKNNIYPLNSPITKIKLFNSPITKNSDLFHEPLSCFTKIILYHHSPS